MASRSIATPSQRCAMKLFHVTAPEAVDTIRLIGH